MSITSRPLLALMLLGVFLAGCTESQRPTATGEGTIRGVHAMPTAPGVIFLIEERALGTVSYKGSTGAETFDDLTYDFNFDVRLPGDAESRRLATQSLTVVPDTDYVFALTGSLDDPSIVLWETPERMWNGDETVLEISAGHLAPSVGDLDVYLAAPGTAPVAGDARGTLSFGDKLEPFEVEAGDYVLTLTTAGDPSDVLFRSTTHGLTERTSITYTVQDADPSITSTVSVQRASRNGSTSNVADARFPATRRFFHAAHGVTNVDVVADEDFNAPLVANLAFGTLSNDVAVPAGETNFSFTQAGNPGSIVHEEEQTVTRNTRSTTFLAGGGSELELVTLADNRRPIADLAKLRMTFISQNQEQVDLWLLEAGTDIADTSPNFPNVDTGDNSGYLQLAGGNYELTVTFGDEETVAVGPVPIDLANGDVVELVIIDTADPNVLDVVVYDP